MSIELQIKISRADNFNALISLSEVTKIIFERADKENWALATRDLEHELTIYYISSKEKDEVYEFCQLYLSKLQWDWHLESEEKSIIRRSINS